MVLDSKGFESLWVRFKASRYESWRTKRGGSWEKGCCLLGRFMGLGNT